MPKMPIAAGRMADAGAEYQRTLRTIQNAQKLAQTVQPGTPARGVEQTSVEALIKPIMEEAGQRLAEGLKAGKSPADVMKNFTETIAGAIASREMLRGLRDDPRDPAPSEPSTMLQTAKEAVEIHRDAALTAREMAEMERQRREEAEDNIGAAVQSAESRRDELWKFLAERDERYNTLFLKTLEDRHASELAARDSEMQRMFTELSQKFDTVSSAHQAELERVRLQAETESKLKDAEHQHALAIKELEAKRALAGAGIQDPETAWKMAQVQRAKAEVAHYEESLADQRQRANLEHDARLASQQKMGEFVDDIKGLIKEQAPKVIDLFAAGGTKRNPRIPANASLEPNPGA